MKATHKLRQWFRWYGAHKYTQSLQWYNARIKKNGTIMYWVGVHRVCMGSYPPYLCYFDNEKSANTPRTGRHQDSFGKIKRYQVYYTLEKL
jgi:hypothetical protein